MIKNVVEFSYQEGEKVCRFTADQDTDIQLAKRALCDFLKKLGIIEDQAKAQQEIQDESNIETKEEINRESLND